MVISLFSLFTIIFGSGIILSLTYYDMQDIFTILFTFKDNILIYVINLLEKFISKDLIINQTDPSVNDTSLSNGNVNNSLRSEYKAIDLENKFTIKDLIIKKL